MIAGDGDGVELRHLLRSIFENIGDDTHGEFRRVDIGVTHHEFFQDIVLDRTGHFFQLGALFQTGIDIECQYRKNTTIHGHRNRHLVQRNTGKQNFHVFQRTDRHTGFTDVTYHTFIVGIITTVCRKVESDRQTFLAGSQVTTVECVGLFSSRETCILADRPRTHSVHTAIRTTQIRRQTGSIVQVFHSFQIFFSIYGFHLDVLGCFPIGLDAIGFSPFGSVSSCKTGILYIYVFKIWSHNYFYLSDS